MLPATGPRRAAEGLGRALRGAREHALFYGVLAGFVILCLAWSLPAALLFRLLPRSAGEPLGQAGISRGFRFYVGLMRATGMLRCDPSALDTLRGERGLVIAANHPSLLDAVLVTSRLPGVVCITKASLWNNPLLGGGVRLAGYVRNDATLPMLRDAAAAVRAGRQLLIFPEGTRTARGPVGPLSRSFAVMARMAEAPVQCVLIETDSPYLRKGWPLWRKPALPIRYRVRLGRRFPAGGGAQALASAVEAHFRQALAGAPAGGGRAGDEARARAPA